MEEQNQNWIQQNWKWALPLGCGVPIFCIVFIGVIVTGVFALIKNSEVYTTALTAAQTNERAIAILGEPISDGWFVNGNIETNTTNGVKSGEANLRIPVSGPDGSGTIIVDADIVSGEWWYHQLELQFDNGEPSVDLKRP